MASVRKLRNRQKLIASAVSLAAVVVCAAIVQRNRGVPPAVEHSRDRSEPQRAVYGQPAPVQTPEPPSAIPDAAGIRQFLERWRTTVVRGDLEGHVACYAPVVEHYFRQRNVKKAQVVRDKQRMMQLWPDVRRYEISGIQVEESEGDRAVVSFRKDWDARSPSRRFTGSEKQRLTLRNSSGKWQIIGEEEVKVYHVSRR